MDYGIVMKAIQLARDTMERLREHVLVTVLLGLVLWRLVSYIMGATQSRVQ
jgi:hypothetical protein